MELSGRHAVLSNKAYTILDQYFTAHEDEVVEIEMLPPAIQPEDGICMIDGLSLGIPKKILALAFLEARRLFFQHKDDASVSTIALAASKVMLLFDTEQITAANLRKKQIVQVQQETEKTVPNESLKALLRREIDFLDSILTSPLHRQSKSPTLWYHRSWLLQYLVSNAMSLPGDHKETLLDFSRKELSAVYKSGERHPKNYYAWQYARTLVTHLVGSQESVTETQQERADFLSVFIKETVDSTKSWCCSHPSDISGWSFLLFLLRMSPSKSNGNLLADVVHIVTRLRLDNESAWIFIRTALDEPSIEKDAASLHDVLQQCEKQQDDVDADLFAKRIRQILSYLPNDSALKG
ncbi:hypothetical protein BU24DRAFT_464595 [Aaosphaeria arxii CBS 175.79]|uniref:Protein prenylyltransferase n=1 Tax=Aaosphaeria arxii CBS 175.79 TaxID=1450172 RepID=A0A6A5XKQ4_9PLEO|nr:uncharacterized protein BU24DRAFT_464595 [Aaosphaeria arxii CBS 175.79]KAF2013868.1 hypothetical protein BU24DRAFT_464595 [Aaosphaeria arxii CBS 175.79]